MWPASSRYATQHSTPGSCDTRKGSAVRVGNRFGMSVSGFDSVCGRTTTSCQNSHRIHMRTPSSALVRPVRSCSSSVRACQCARVKASARAPRSRPACCESCASTRERTELSLRDSRLRFSMREVMKATALAFAPSKATAIAMPAADATGCPMRAPGSSARRGSVKSLRSSRRYDVVSTWRKWVA
eukprot:scaffold77578_cov62-Phaeocystis_antarctica.AAC.5